MLRKILFAGMVVGLAGCLSPQTPGRSAGRPELLASAQAAIMRDDWDDAAVLIGRFLRENPNDPWAPQARYLLGAYYFKENELDSAEREFSSVAAQAGPGRLTRQAQVRVADVAAAARQYDRAALLFTQLLQSAKLQGDGAELTFKLGLVRQRQGRWSEADALFQRVLGEYGGSVFATRAAEQRAVPHHFCLQVGAFDNRVNAESKKKNLAERGHQASVQELQRHGKPLYCVCVGSFDTSTKAADFRSTMLADPDLRISDVVP
jgi:TolA-binding protein